MLCSVFLPTGRDVWIRSELLAAEMSTVTGEPVGTSSVRVRIHPSRSISNGKSSHQPWLMTVRLKLKPGVVGMYVCIKVFESRCLQGTSYYKSASDTDRNVNTSIRALSFSLDSLYHRIAAARGS